MASSSETASARELALVSKLEMRIALADTDEKLQALLQKFLAPLLLKVGADSLGVKTKAINVCQHIITRIEPTSIVLPVPALLKQFKEADSPFVRHFDMLYIKLGLSRMSPAERANMLPALLDGISKLEEDSVVSSIAFQLVISLLPTLKLPVKSSEEDVALREKLGITPETARWLSKWFGKLLLFPNDGENAKNCPGLSEAEFKFLSGRTASNRQSVPLIENRSNPVETKVSVMQFLASGAFNDSERFLPAVIASAIPNSRISDIGDDILKRFKADLENDEVVDQLFALYLGQNEPTSIPPAPIPVRAKVLSLLCKSAKATADVNTVERIIDDGLQSNELLAGQGLQGLKFRNQLFSFMAWFARMASPSDLNRISPNGIEGLKSYILSQGWPKPSARLGPTDSELRSLAYESIGLLLPKTGPSLDAVSKGLYLQTTRWLFVSLGCDDSSDQIAVSIDQALGALLNILGGNAAEELQRELRETLLRQFEYKVGNTEAISSEKIVRSTAFAAARFSNRCLPFSDPVGRWMAILASSSTLPELAEEGRKGLDPDWYRMLNIPYRPEAASDFHFPRFNDLVDFILGQPAERDNTHTPYLLSRSHFPAYRIAVAFLRNILLWEGLQSNGFELEIEPDWEFKLDSIISTKENARSALERYLRECDPEPVARFLETALKGFTLHQALDPGRALSHALDILSLSPNGLLTMILPSTAPMFSATTSTSPLNQPNAARIVGILASHPDSSKHVGNEFESNLFSTAPKAPTTLREQNVGETRALVLLQAYWLSRMSFRRRDDPAIASRTQRLLSSVLEILENSKNTELRESALIAIGQLGLGCLVLPDNLPAAYDFSKVITLLAGEVKKGKELAIQALGRISTGLYKSEVPTSADTLDQLKKPLFDLFESREVEVHFAVGEALSVVATGWRSKSLITEFDVDGQVPELAISPQELTAILEKAITSCKSPAPSTRKSSIIWLLSLIRYCGSEAPVQDYLRTCQVTFLRLLSDRDEIVQDTASRGLSLVYEMGSREFKDDLVQDLVQFFTTDKSKLSGGKLSAGSELFEPGDLPTGDGSITTYKDIVNLASEVGNPSLVYRFMSLASDKAMWTSRAAFGRFGLSNILSDSNVGGYLAQNPKLYPKLYRYMFDPNTNVQASMKSIWNVLVKDPNAVIDAHFDAIMEELLSGMMNGKEWRVRQASCSAMANLIQSQQVEKYDKYLKEILTKTFKVIDDIKGSVRLTALKLGQTLSAIVIRTLEKGETQSKRATLMLDHIVPFLLGRDGLESAADEVRAFSILTLRDIIRKSPGKALSPYVPQILETFLMNLSSMESQIANYLHLNADKYGMTGQDVDKLRLSGLRSSPIMEVIESHLLDSIDEKSMKEVAERLQNVLRSAIGMPSKVACSRVLAMLSRKPVLFEPYADRFMQLARTHALDRNETIGASYSTAMGYLARIASDEQILKTIDFTKSLYFNSQEDSHRSIAAEILNCLSKHASDRVSKLAAAFLPLVFIGKHDTDAQIKEDFDKVWNDNVSGSRMVMLYLNEILELVSVHIESPKWAVKHACALSSAGIVTSLGDPIDPKATALLWPVLQKAIGGRTWEGKGTVFEGFIRFAERTRAFWGERQEVSTELTTIALREAKRNNAQYRPCALRCLAKYAKLREDLDLALDALKASRDALDQLEDGSKDKMDVDSGNAASKTEEETCTAIVECVLGCLNPRKATPNVFADHITQAGAVLDKAVRLGGKATYDSLYECSKDIFDRLREDGIKEDDQLKAAFLRLSDGSLFLDVSPPRQETRNKRGDAVLSFLEACQTLKIQPSQRQTERLDAWFVAGERSVESKETFAAVQRIRAEITSSSGGVVC